MRKTAFIFAGIMATVIGTAYATGENTVTSKSYVDAMDATKQDAISAGTTGNVVTYNGEDSNGQAQFSEKGIYSGAAQYSNSDSDKLITAEVVHDFAAAVETLTVPDNKLVGVDENGDPRCQSNNSCTLWQITTGTASLAAQGTFAPLTAAACKAYGESVLNGSASSECCSGRHQPCGRGATYCSCGCATDTDCPSGQTCGTGYECS